MVKSLLQPQPRLAVVQSSICSLGKTQVLYPFQFAGLGIHLNSEVEIQSTIRLVAYHRIDIIMQPRFSEKPFENSLSRLSNPVLQPTD